MSKESRRKLLKSIAAGSGAIVAGKLLPESWSKPVVDSVMLPAHAQTSPQPTSSSPSDNILFTSSGSLTVPAGITQVNIIALGAQGGDGGLGNPGAGGTGGLGGQVSASLSVSGGDLLDIVVGLRGLDGDSVPGPTNPGGTGGDGDGTGGDGGPSDGDIAGAGGGGGGGSSVALNTTVVIIAGGGGGGGGGSAVPGGAGITGGEVASQRDGTIGEPANPGGGGGGGGANGGLGGSSGNGGVGGTNLVPTGGAGSSGVQFGNGSVQVSY